MVIFSMPHASNLRMVIKVIPIGKGLLFFFHKMKLQFPRKQKVAVFINKFLPTLSTVKCFYCG